MIETLWVLAEVTEPDGRQSFLRFQETADTKPDEAARRCVARLVPGATRLNRIYVFETEPIEYAWDIVTRKLT